MKTLVRYIASKTIKPVVKKYLSKTRVYRYKTLTLMIPPEVFHPAFFFSTKILLGYVLQLELNKKKILELGAGSGLISFAAAGRYADVTATDINPVAVEYLKINSGKNQLPIRIILSDLFDNILEQQFDIIVINPPYYKKDPKTNLDYAWYCGVNGEYFHKLFSSIKKYMHGESLVLMILSEDCDIEMIKSIAANNCFFLKHVYTRKNLMEKDFIFSIKEIA